MCCLVVILAFLGPRVALIVTWLFTEKTTFAFESFWYGALGWVFLPWTTLMYSWCYQPVFGVSGFGWLLVAFGFMADIATWFGGGNRARSAS
jgi:hypothetical protein